MTVARTIWGSTSTFTITLASLASDANLSTGRIGNAVDLTPSTVPIDVMIGGSFTLSSVSTTSLVGGRVEIWAAGNLGGSTALTANVSTADAAFSASFYKNVMKLITVIPVTTTPIAPANSPIIYWGPCSVAQAFGGTLPDLFNLFVTHNLSAAFHANASSHWYQYVNYASS